MSKIGFYLILLLQATFLLAQTTVVTGKVTEAKTGAPIPFATVVFSGTTEGALTDFEGKYRAVTQLPVDSIFVSYIGFKRRTKTLKTGQEQVINFQLEEDVTTLQEIIVTPKDVENPAFAIIRRIVRNKDLYDKRSLDAFEYESYVRTELSLDNISEAMKQRKLMQKVMAVMDSMEQIAGEDGKPLLPLMISESISRMHIRKTPYAKHEDVLKTKISGVGVSDGSVISQILGSSYQEYNFYENWMNIIGKQIMSPIADGWRIIYDYDLTDSLYIGDDFCYQINFFPKQQMDLAFRGTMWITTKDYALKQIDASVTAGANINYVDKLKVQQELEPTTAGTWLPSKTRVLIDIKPLSKNTAGFLAKFYISNKDFVINEPRTNSFYMNKISVQSDVIEEEESYWNTARHDSLTSTEISIFSMIDTLNNIPSVKNTTETIRFLTSGYLKAGKISIGPYTTLVGNNNIEGFRLGIGFRTNKDFSQKWTFGGYTGYGFDDKEWKYNAYVSYLANRNPWTEIKYQQQRELEQIWLLNEDVEASSLFYTFSRWGTLVQPFMKTKYQLSLERQLGYGLNAGIDLKHVDLQPLFDFQYFTNEQKTTTASSYSINEVVLSAKYGKDEILLVNNINRRVSLGPVRYPLYNFSYTYGASSLDSDFSYHKVKLEVEKRQKLGIIGLSTFRLGGGYLFGTVPYPLLFNPIGNETPIYAGFAFNLMNFFEFSSDRYVEFKYRHSFQGFVLNRIPLLRKLKWRLFANANGLLGSIRDKNIQTTDFPTDVNGNPILPFRQWESIPYLEAGYGIENIFKVFSIQAFHRLTYLNADVPNFGVKVNVTLRF